MSTFNALPPLPKVGPIGYASVVDIDSYTKTLVIGAHLPGVRDVALWTTDQKRAYAIAAIAAASPASAPPDYTVHSCSYFCELPGCIKQQRDEFRDKMASAAMPADLLHLWETIYDHGAGKHKGAVSMAQRQKAFEIVKRMGQAAPQPPTLEGGA